MITGALVAIATPMRDDGSIDYDCYQKLIDWQVSEGADAIVSMGTSGESPTVSFEEHTAVVKAAVEAAAGRVPVIAGTGANSTAEAIRVKRLKSALSILCRWSLTTTSPRRKVSSSISPPWRERAGCR